jgi:quercetin dioxygenase-like cupin family protein
LSEREIVCGDLSPALDDLLGDGFRIELIYPADDPHTAIVARGDDRMRVTSQPDASPIPAQLPPFAPEFGLTHAGGSAGQGRAGMLYRDLVPSRLGGRYIISHISIPGGGPVSDWVHFHKITLQLLYVRRGWVRVVYEDQGEPFVMREGDLVLQPPEIRHRVLESSSAFEIIEIGAPAVHATFGDHALELPNGSNPFRMFGGQRFLHHKAAETPWTPFGGGEAKETGLADATDGLAAARTIRPSSGEIEFAPLDGELVFGFVLDGEATLEYRDPAKIRSGDSFVIPPGERWHLTNPSADFRLLHVTTARLD